MTIGAPRDYRRMREPTWQAAGRTRLEDWPSAPLLRGDRIVLEPLREDHAVEMAPLLGDAALHIFIGGEPPTSAQLKQRYRRQVVGHSPDGMQRWLNWIIRLEDRDAIGTAQATVVEARGQCVAELAWVVATAYQGQGLAKAAAQLMSAWLRSQGVMTLVANIHPDHAASQAVARSIGLAPTTTLHDGEVRWQG